MSKSSVINNKPRRFHRPGITSDNQKPRLEFGSRSESKSPSNSPSEYLTPLLDKSAVWTLYESAPKVGRLEFMNAELQSRGLHTVVDYAGARILIDKKMTDRDSGYTQYVGSILEVTDSNLSILSTMQPVITATARLIPKVIKHWTHLDSLCAEDGTTLGLYWFKNAWVVRTMNSFDASGIIWGGRVTFSQMLADVMAKYPQFRYENLDTTKCYTFGIKHPAIHAYQESLDHPVLRSWFIQSTDIKKVNDQNGVFNGTVSFEESIGLNPQRPMTPAVISGMAEVGLCRDPKYNNALGADADVKNAAGVSLIDILDTTYGALGGVISGSSNAAANYFGVILRSKKMTFFIPSDLYEYIASTCYTREINGLLDEEKFNRYKFIVLYNSLCPDRKRNVFMKIYPNYSGAIAKIRQYLETFVDLMFRVFDNMYHNAPNDDVGPVVDLARSIVINWIRIYGEPGSSESPKVKSMFSEYIMDPKNTSAFYNLIYDNLDLGIN